MLSQDRSTLLNLAISKFNPEIFSHPVWLRFGTNELSVFRKISEDLLQAARNIQLNEPSGACQILLLCAVYQNYIGKSDSARATVQDALALARNCGLFNEVLWALWGACAVSFQQGKFEQAANYLINLEEELLLQNEWVLADFVEIVKQTLLNSKNNDEKHFILSRDPPLQDLLLLTFEWLQKWGCFAQSVQVNLHATLKHPVHQIVKKKNSIPSFFSLSDWEGKLHSLMHLFLKGKNQISQNTDLAPKASIPHYSVKENFYPNGQVHGQMEPGINVVVQMLGTFTISIQDTLMKLTATRGLSVFKYLLFHHKQSIPREVLMDIFWPDVDPDSARNNLNVALHALRKELRFTTDAAVVCHEHGAYCLSPNLKIWLDVEEFEKCIKTGKQCESSNKLTVAVAEYEIAINLYQGELLADSPYEDWIVLDRERIRIAYLDTIDRLSQIYFENERYSACLMFCQKILNHDTCREDIHYRVMQCYSRLGQSPLALRQYQNCVEALHAELEIEPAPETIQLYDRIRNHRAV